MIFHKLKRHYTLRFKNSTNLPVFFLDLILHAK
jgi:hypothetical protein